jgi:DNA-binding CsgD family transcriptional regulator
MTIIRRLPPATPDQLATLTPRQLRRYNALRTGGFTQRALAAREGITEHSVSHAVRRIAARLGWTDERVSARRQARSLPVLKAGTEDYADHGYRMLWVARASEKYGFPVTALLQRDSRRQKALHRQTRLVSDPTVATGKVFRTFVRENECPGVKAWWDSLQKYTAAAVDARGRGLKPASEVARALGVSSAKVHDWCSHGCRRLSKHAKPVHEWIGPFGDKEQQLWVSSESERQIKAAPAYPYIDQPGKGRYIHSSEAGRRCTCTTRTLHRMHKGEISVPGGGEFDRVRGPRNDWYYHEGHVNAVAQAKKPGRGRRVRGPLKKKQWTTKDGLALSTNFVAELCGAYGQQVHCWGKGQLTREGLKLRPAGKLRVEGCTLCGWRADDAIAIARARGREIPPDLDEEYPPNGNGSHNGNGDSVGPVNLLGEKSRPKGKRGRPGPKPDEAWRRTVLVDEWKERSRDRRCSRQDFCDDFNERIRGTFGRTVDVEYLETARDWYDKQTPGRLAAFRAFRNIRAKPL